MPKSDDEPIHDAQMVAMLRRCADALDAIHGTLAALLDTVKWAAGERSEPTSEERW